MANHTDAQTFDAATGASLGARSYSGSELTEIRERLAVAGGFALLVAGLVLVMTVLPAEYGLDPLGTGEALGLTAIAPPAEAEASQAATDLEPVRPGANVPQPAGYKRDSIKFELKPGQGIEYKYQLEKGQAMVYSWESTGKVRYDFHGEPQGAPRNYAESYEMDEKESANGAFFAPTSGIHGWYWENTGASDVVITLTSAGFYQNSIEFRATGRIEHKLSAD